jgi:tryptophan-rich sensory protein
MPVVGEAHVVVRAITTGFEDDVRRGINNGGLSRIGQQAGQSLSNGFSKGSGGGKADKFAKEIENARLKLQQLVMQSYFVGPAVGVAASALSSLASAAFAMGSQVAAALPSLIVLPSIFSAMGQAMVTAKLAFSGVGKAIGALNKQQKGVDKIPGLLERYSNAQDRLADSKKRLKKAEEALTEARDSARESLEQLNFDSEDAAIAEKRASIELVKARETLLRMQDLPPNSAARKEAQLAYEEADLNFRRAKDRNSDLAKESEKRNAAGVEGSKEVLDAIENVTEAEKARNKAIIEQAKAKKELDDAQAGKGAGAGANPLEGLSPEAAAFAKYIAGLKPKLDELKASAGKDLFPALETAIDNLVKNLFPTLNTILRDTGKALGQSAIDFSKIVTEANNLKNLNTVAGTNKDTIGKLGKVVGNLYSVFLSLLAAADPLIRRFTDWFVVLTNGWKTTAEAKNQSGALTKTFEYAGDVAAQLGTIFGNLGRAIFDIGTSAAGPGSGGEMLLDMLEGATEKFQKFVDKAQEGGKLEQFFRDVATNAAAIGRLFNAIVLEFGKLGNNKEVGTFADSLIPAVETIGKALDTFTNASPALGEFIVKLVDLLAKFAETGSINTFFGVLGKILDVLNVVFGNPIMMKIVGVLSIIKAVMIALSVATKVFGFYGRAILGTVAKLLGLGNTKKGLMIIQKLFRVQQLAGTAVTTKSTVALIRQKIATKLSGVATKAWAAITKGATVVANGFTKAMKLLRAAALANPFVAIVVGIVALIALLVLAYKKIDRFKRFVDAIFRGIVTVVKVVVGAISDAFMWLYNILIGNSIIPDIVNGIIFFFKKAWEFIKVVVDLIVGAFKIAWGIISTVVEFAWNNIIKPIFEAFGTVFGLVWDGIKLYYTTVWDIISTGISFAWNKIIKPIFEAFGTVFGLVWDGIKLYYTTIWGIISTGISFAWNNVIKPVFEAFGTVFGKIWDGIKSAFSRTWDFITGAIGKAKEIFGGLGESIKDAFKTAFNFVADLWNNSIGKIGFKAPKWLGGWEFSVPDIPKLAQGGVVSPRSGGTLAMIAEAGRPERVEPLDPDGLSKRDKAMISLLAGGTGGGGTTINVYPSPGMNEVELAALVNRQISFQIRKGAA